LKCRTSRSGISIRSWRWKCHLH